MNRWRRHGAYIQTEYYPAFRKNPIMLFAATWVDLEVIRLWCKSDRERQISHDIAYMQNLKKKETWNYLQNKQIHLVRGQTYGYHGEGWGQDRLGVWDWSLHTALF